MLVRPWTVPRWGTACYNLYTCYNRLYTRAWRRLGKFAFSDPTGTPRRRRRRRVRALRALQFGSNLTDSEIFCFDALLCGYLGPRLVTPNWRGLESSKPELWVVGFDSERLQALLLSLSSPVLCPSGCGPPHPHPLHAPLPQPQPVRARCGSRLSEGICTRPDPGVHRCLDVLVPVGVSCCRKHLFPICGYDRPQRGQRAEKAKTHRKCNRDETGGCTPWHSLRCTLTPGPV